MATLTPDIPEPRGVYPLFRDYEERLWTALNKKGYYKDAIIARYAGVQVQHLRFWRRLSLVDSPQTECLREFFQELNERQADIAAGWAEQHVRTSLNSDDPDKQGRTFEKYLPDMRTEDADTISHGIAADHIEAEYLRQGVQPQEFNTSTEQSRGGQLADNSTGIGKLRGPAIAAARFAKKYYPSYCNIEFAVWHREILEWATSIQYGAPPSEHLCSIVNRDGGKSTIAEIVLAYLMASGRRGYAMYVCGTQRQSNDHVTNVSGLLQNEALNEDFANVSDVALDKNNRSLGWKTTRLTSAAGFTIDAVGIDSQIRGAKIDDKRVDFIILDDIDDSTDTPARVEKKLEALGRKIFPAGSGNLAVLSIQNLISSYSVFARIKDGNSEVLKSRVIGPIPAIADLKTDPPDPVNTLASDGVKIVSGTPTWEGFGLDKAQNMIDLIGIRSFLAEHQHQVDVMGGVAFAAHWKKQYVEVELEDNPPDGFTIRRCYDYGSTRPWAYALYAEADGESEILINGKYVCPPAGSLLFLEEVYGWTGTPNVGTNQSSSEHADDILEHESVLPCRARIQDGPADGQIFEAPDNGESIAEIMASKGLHWTRANRNPGSRKAGAELMREMLNNTVYFAQGAFPTDSDGVEKVGPCIYFSRKCENLIRTIPNLPADKKPGRDGDVDTNAEDHAWDIVRYAILGTGTLETVDLGVG